MAGLQSNLPIMPMVLLLVAAYLMPTVARLRPHWCAPVATLSTGFSSLGSVFLAVQVISSGEAIYYNLGGWPPPWGIGLKIGPAEAFMLLVVNGIALLILSYTLANISHELPPRAVDWYYTVFLLCLAAMVGIIMTNDLFNLYVFVEVSGITACALVAAKGNRKSTVAALKYLYLATIGSGFLLFGVAILYQLGGHLNVDYAKEALALIWTDYPRVIWVAISFLLVGFGVKAALFPLHVWLPDAHSSAPTPSSAILSGLVVKVYAFALLRLMYTVLSGPLSDPATASMVRHAILIAAVMAMLVGSVFAIIQQEIKRLLAYSTVAQLGYIFLGIGLGTRAALVAALMHILFHALMKAGLFLAAGAIALRTDARYVHQYEGMARRLPISMGIFSVCALSMIGLPGFAGLISKWYLGAACLEAGYPVLLVVLVCSSLLNAVYYLPILGRAYLGQASGPRLRVPRPMLIPMCILAGLNILFGLWPAWPLSLAQTAARHLLP